jgi:hypothetical protein
LKAESFALNPGGLSGVDVTGEVNVMTDLAGVA